MAKQEQADTRNSMRIIHHHPSLNSTSLSHFVNKAAVVYLSKPILVSATPSLQGKAHKVSTPLSHKLNRYASKQKLQSN
jgi:hypothetical protein